MWDAWMHGGMDAWMYVDHATMQPCGHAIMHSCRHAIGTSRIFPAFIKFYLHGSDFYNMIIYQI